LYLPATVAALPVNGESKISSESALRATDPTIRSQPGTILEARFQHKMISATEALERLKDGNRRFVATVQGDDGAPGSSRQLKLTTAQEPFAIILGCSDARVPAELVFDQGLGDLFVIRVAGNIVAPSQVGSVEFAAERFGTRLVVVLGHTRCGAIQATLEALANPEQSASRNLMSIVDRVRPSVQGLLELGISSDSDAFRHQAVKANVRTSVDHLRHGSAILEQLILNDGLIVVGAEYSVESGEVEFFD
jgi:carbonic anhydrase